MREFMIRKFLVLEEKMIGINFKKSIRLRRKSKSIIPEEYLINVKPTIPERNREIEKIIYNSMK